MSDARLTRMRDDAYAIFLAGVEAVKGHNAVRRHCRVEKDRFVVDGRVYRLSGSGDVFVIGAGKAAACMARAIEDLLGSRISRGIVNVKYGHLAQLDRIQLVEAGHPVPDEAGRRGARAIFELASGAREGDLVICVISGGGSALLPLPVEGVALADKQETTRVLLACGAGIREINAEAVLYGDTEDELATQLALLADTPELREEMRDRGLANVQRFSFEARRDALRFVLQSIGAFGNTASAPDASASRPERS